MNGDAGDGDARTSEGDSEGGGPVPQQFPSETYPGEREPLSVRVWLAANGCFLGSVGGTSPARSYLVVWPAGTEGAGDQVRLPDGTMVGNGDRLSGPGTLMPITALEGIGASSFWQHTVGFCDDGAERVLVLDVVTKD